MTTARLSVQVSDAAVWGFALYAACSRSEDPLLECCRYCGGS